MGDVVQNGDSAYMSWVIFGSVLGLSLETSYSAILSLSHC
jgi:hypothetical protein